MAGTLQVSGAQTGIVEGTRQIGPLSITMSSVGAVTETVLASSNNTITNSTVSVGVIVIPPSGGTVPLTLKGASGDTGIVLSPANWSVISWTTTPPASFIVTTTAASTGAVGFLFF